MWRSLEGISPAAWQPALEMAAAEVAETSHTPTGWRHDPLRLPSRRVRLDAARISHSPRSRRRRTIPAEQLALALSGELDTVYGYSFIITDLLCPAVAEELWKRRLAHIEERVRNGESNGLTHLPLGTMRATFGWLVATVTAANLMAMLSATLRTGAPQAERSQPERSTTPGNCTCACRGAGGGPTPSPPPLPGYACSRSPEDPPSRQSLRPSQHPELPHALIPTSGPSGRSSNAQQPVRPAPATYNRSRSTHQWRPRTPPTPACPAPSALLTDPGMTETGRGKSTARWPPSRVRPLALLETTIPGPSRPGPSAVLGG